MNSSVSTNSSCGCTANDPNGPDPDIAGPGVIIGFLLTGALTFGSSYIMLWLQSISSRSGRSMAFLRRLTPSSVAADPVAFWMEAFTDFNIDLSDQQLLLGLLLLICAYIKYWPSAVMLGADNLWTAGDIVCFSIFTHAATLLSLRSHFRKHLKLATVRVTIMFLVYILWLIVAALELQPNKPKGSSKKAEIISRFWHVTIVLEAVGIMWIYLISYLPLFLSEEATEVRNAISERHEENFGVITAWINRHKRRRSSGLSNRTGWRRLNPYATIRSYNTRMAVRFAEAYVQPTSKARRWLLWLAAELLFPWYIASFILTLTWILSLGALIVSLVQSGLASDTWSFGQLLPAVLVLLPFQTFVTAITDAYGEGEEQPPPHHHDAKRRTFSQSTVDGADIYGSKHLDFS